MAGELDEIRFMSKCVGQKTGKMKGNPDDVFDVGMIACCGDV